MLSLPWNSVVLERGTVVIREQNPNPFIDRLYGSSLDFELENNSIYIFSWIESMRVSMNNRTEKQKKNKNKKQKKIQYCLSIECSIVLRERKGYILDMIVVLVLLVIGGDRCRSERKLSIDSPDWMKRLYLMMTVVVAVVPVSSEGTLV
jgi:hypothetical protein